MDFMSPDSVSPRSAKTVLATASFLPLDSLEAVHFDYRDELDLPGLRPSPSPLWTVGSGLPSLQSASLEQSVEDIRRKASSGFGAGAPPKSWSLPDA